MNERAVEAAMAALRPYSREDGTPAWERQLRTATTRAIDAYLASLREQGVVVVEQSTEACERCQGTGRCRVTLATWGAAPSPCAECKGSGKKQAA